MAEDYLKYFFKDDLYENISNHTILIVLVAFFVVLLALHFNISRKKYKLPPGPKGVPILGYIPFLGPEPLETLDNLKKVYGNSFSLYLGRTYAVVLGDFEVVKETFSKPEVSARPDGIFDFFPDGTGISNVNGEEWSEQRKFSMKVMAEIGVGKKKWESMLQVEVEDFVQIVSSFEGEPFDITCMLSSSISNNIMSFVLGKRLPYNHPDRIFLNETLIEIMKFFESIGIYGLFPILRDISVMLGLGSPAKMHKKMKKFNNFFRTAVKEIRESFTPDAVEYDNFVEYYLKEIEKHKGKTGHYFNERNLYGNIQALFLGGSDTANESICWLILAMANFPDIQDRIFNEVNAVLGTEGKLKWSDRKKLPYTYATIMEGQRWRTVAPLSLLRITTKDIRIENYDIPKGTNIIPNIWSIHMDPKYWKEPEKFQPERFLTEDGKDVKTKLDSYIPFSYGKRNCPGEQIAMMEILMYFTALIQKFKISVPNGKKVNLKGRFGLIYHPIPQNLHFTLRE